MENERDRIEEAFNRYLGDRQPYFWWEEIPRTKVWYDKETNRFETDVNIGVSFDGYDIDQIQDCLYDLYLKIWDTYRRKGIVLHEVPPGL